MPFFPVILGDDPMVHIRGSYDVTWEPCSVLSSTKPLFRSMLGLTWQG